MPVNLLAVEEEREAPVNLLADEPEPIAKPPVNLLAEKREPVNLLADQPADTSKYVVEDGKRILPDPSWKETIKSLPARMTGAAEEVVGGAMQLAGESPMGAVTKPLIESTSAGMAAKAVSEIYTRLTGKEAPVKRAKEALVQKGIEFGEEGRKLQEEATPPQETFWQEATASAGVSLSQMIPGVIASVATRSPYPMIAAISAQSASSKYSEARDKGLAPDKALRAGMIEGAIEGVTELVPAKVAFKVGTPAFKRLVNFMVWDMVTI